MLEYGKIHNPNLGVYGKYKINYEKKIMFVIWETKVRSWYSFEEKKEFFLESQNDKPAVINSQGEKLWYKHGVFHRENGPAIITENRDYYWENNKHIKTIEKKKNNSFNLMELYQKYKKKYPNVPYKISTKLNEIFCIDKTGTYHSYDDAPAIINYYCKKWYRHGEFHRENGPAVISSNHKSYWLDGRLIKSTYY